MCDFMSREEDTIGRSANKAKGATGAMGKAGAGIGVGEQLLSDRE